MKKIIVAGLAILGVVDLAALAYLNQRQNEAEKRIEEGIRKDLDERRQIEDSIKGQIESKKQAQAFVLQQEYVRQIDDMTQQLQGLAGALEASALRHAESLKKLEDTADRLQEQISYLKQEFGQQLGAYKLQAQESSRKSFAYIKQLEESGIRHQEQLTQLEGAFSRQMQSLASRLTRYTSRLREYQRKVDVLSAKAPAVPKEGSSQ